MKWLRSGRAEAACRAWARTTPRRIAGTSSASARPRSSGCGRSRSASRRDESLSSASASSRTSSSRLDLGVRAQVLDVGCGPGWLSEFLARCGYAVTGVDVSEDMVEIARRRIAAIDRPIGQGIEPLAEFHAMPVLDAPWRNRFDAAILYDAMHHFHDEVETLRVIRRTLARGGSSSRSASAPGSRASRSWSPRWSSTGRWSRRSTPSTSSRCWSRLRGRFTLRGGRRAARRLGAGGRAPPVEERLAFPPMNTVIAVNPVPRSSGTPRRSSEPASRPPDRCASWTTSSPSQFRSRTPAARSGRRTRRAARRWLGDHRALHRSASGGRIELPRLASRDRSLPESRPRSSSGCPGRP